MIIMLRSTTKTTQHHFLRFAELISLWLANRLTHFPHHLETIWKENNAHYRSFCKTAQDIIYRIHREDVPLCLYNCPQLLPILWWLIWSFEGGEMRFSYYKTPRPVIAITALASRSWLSQTETPSLSLLRSKDCFRLSIGEHCPLPLASSLSHWSLLKRWSPNSQSKSCLSFENDFPSFILDLSATIDR